MNEDFISAVTQANEIRMGETAALLAMTEALTATILMSFPPLAAQLQQHIEMSATMHRQDMTPEDELANKAYERRISDYRSLIAALLGN